MKKNIRKYATCMAIAATMVVSMTACSSKKDAASDNAANNDNTESTAKYTAGKYTAAGTGKNGDVNVTVTFDENSIVSVVVGDHAETAGLAEPAIETIPQAIVDGQTLKVDVVSGATVTSEAILAAVEDCVTQAGADAATLK